MKQFGALSVALSDGAATLIECSNSELVKWPRLTIMTPHRPGLADDHDLPPMSVKLEGEEVEALYLFLKRYYEHPT